MSYDEVVALCVLSCSLLFVLVVCWIVLFSVVQFFTVLCYLVLLYRLTYACPIACHNMSYDVSACARAQDPVRMLFHKALSATKCDVTGYRVSVCNAHGSSLT